jgi:hypothetical protein
MAHGFALACWWLLTFPNNSLLWNAKVSWRYYRNKCHWNPSSVSSNETSFDNNFNITLPSIFRSPKWSLLPTKIVYTLTWWSGFRSVIGFIELLQNSLLHFTNHFPWYIWTNQRFRRKALLMSDAMWQHGTDAHWDQTASWQISNRREIFAYALIKTQWTS